VGGSAGDVEALTRLAAGLPHHLPYAVLIALHLPPNAPNENYYRCRVRHAWIADTAEHAVTVLGRRLSEATSVAGGRGGG
jgi:chemotaxis response regulator CheB